MDRKEILKRVDHTLLKAYATWEDIAALCDEAIAFETASVCVPPAYIGRIHEIYGINQYLHRGGVPAGLQRDGSEAG